MVLDPINFFLVLDPINVFQFHVVLDLNKAVALKLNNGALRNILGAQNRMHSNTVSGPHLIKGP